MALKYDVRRALEGLSTAIISSTMLKMGVRNTFIRRSRGLQNEPARIAGSAFTLRFLPGREDLATYDSLASSRSTRAAVEEMQDGCVAVVDACGITDAGIFGDIVCNRMVLRKVAGLVTDGAMRDIAGVKQSGLPVWCAGASAAPSIARLTFVGWQQPVACGGVAVFPDDAIVADQDGAVVIPQAMTEAVVVAAKEADALDEWIQREVASGKPLPGLYPPNEENLSRYERMSARQAGAIAGHPEDRKGVEQDAVVEIQRRGGG
jgi:regulator of RNase E activity RraA